MIQTLARTGLSLGVPLLLLAALVFLVRIQTESGEPRILVVAVLAGLALLVLILRQRLLILLSLLLLFVALGELVRLPGVAQGGYTAVPLLGVALAGFWTAEVLFNHRRIVLFPEARLIGFLLLWLLLSTGVNFFFMKEFGHLATFAMVMAFAFIMVQVLRTPGQFWVVGWVIILAMTLVGLSVLAAMLFPELFEYGRYAGYMGGKRFASVAAGGGLTPLYLLPGIIFALSYLFRARRWWERIGLLACLGIMLVADVNTYTVSGILALLVAIGFLVHKRGVSRPWPLARAALIVAGLILATYWLVPAFQMKAGYFVEVIATKESGWWFSQRVGVWTAGLQVMVSHPIFGVGYGNSPWFIPHIWTAPGYEIQEAHTAYLNLGADLGIPALVIFTLLIWLPFRRLARLLYTAWEDPVWDEKSRAVLRGLCASLLGLGIGSLAEGTQQFKPLWLLIGMAIALRLWAEKSSRERLPQVTEPKKAGN